MSSKKTKVAPITKNRTPRKPREFGKSDFKKVSPKDLEKLGFSAKAERYKAPKNFDTSILDKKSLAEFKKSGTISKRKQAQIVFGLTNEQKAEKIKSGARVILENAPKKARAARIVKAFEAREEKAIISHKPRTTSTRPVEIKALMKGRMRFTYYLGHDYDVITESTIEKLRNIHGDKAEARIVMEVEGETRSSQKFLMKNAVDKKRTGEKLGGGLVEDFIAELFSHYAFLKEAAGTGFQNINYYLYVYSQS